MNWPSIQPQPLVIPDLALPPVAEDHSAQPVTQPPDFPFEDLTSFVGADTVVAPFFSQETEPEALESPPTEDIPARRDTGTRSPAPSAGAGDRLGTCSACPDPSTPAPGFDDLGAFVGAATVVVVPSFCRRSLGWRNPQRTSTDS